MEEDEIFEENAKKKLNSIRNKESGTYINILSVIYVISAVAVVLVGIVYFFNNIEAGFIYLIGSIIIASILVTISVVLKMFYEIHYVVTHLKDI